MACELTNRLRDLLLIVTMLAGCTQLLSPSTPVLKKRTQLHMGTLVTITALAPSEEAANNAIDAGFSEIKRLERLLSTWIGTSELSSVNAAAGREPVRVSPETIAVVERSLQVAKLTNGGFNIAIGPAVDAWRVTERQEIPSPEDLQALKALTMLSGVHLDVQSGTIFLETLGMRIDVGGIGKGYAADQAVTAMRTAGANAGVVALSGDVKAFGQLPGKRKFTVGIQHPRKEGAVLAFIDLEDEAISTAGDYEKFFDRDGVRYHHILDPSTLQPARACQSVSVIARDGVWADGLDTGVFVMGPERGMDLVERLPDVEAVIVDHAGNVHISSGLRHRIRFPVESDQEGHLQ
ncbi:MAG: FAD:protein FMN transferase [Nitrospira sp.]|nr:FAD:protein FMN transferase [Nitrospira sp.]